METLLHLSPPNWAAWLVGLEQGTNKLKVSSFLFCCSLHREAKFPVCLLHCLCTEKQGMRGVGWLEVALDQNKQIWD